MSACAVVAPANKRMALDKDLEALRAKIDAVDDGLHDLMMERAELQRQISAAKGGGLVIRPAREAQILRRLFARHKGEPSFAVVGHLIREIIASSVRMQSALEVAVFGGSSRIAVWDIARLHYGTLTDFRACPTARETIDAVKANAETIGVLALDDDDAPEDGQEPWWARFGQDTEAGLQILASLPFFSAQEGPVALAVGRCEQEPTGDDTTLIVLSVEGDNLPDASGRIIARAAGFALAAVPGYVTSEDAVVQEWLSQPEVESGSVIGHFANPIELGQKP